MIDAKLLNRGLWGLNLLLGAGILVFSYQYLLKASDAGLGKDFKPDSATQSVLKSAAQEAKAQFIDGLTSYSQPWWPDRN